VRHSWAPVSTEETSDGSTLSICFDPAPPALAIVREFHVLESSDILSIQPAIDPPFGYGDSDVQATQGQFHRFTPRR
jgi:hypothetical protein